MDGRAARVAREGGAQGPLAVGVTAGRAVEVSQVHCGGGLPANGTNGVVEQWCEELEVQRRLGRFERALASSALQ
jgi:hypothetical protein